MPGWAGRTGARMTAPAELLCRFTRAERWVHRATAALMAVCLVTAAALYVGPFAVLVGRRAFVGRLHVAAGLGLPVPMLVGWLSSAYRRDLARLNRFSADDWRWLRSACLLYTSDAADDLLCVDLGGRRIIKK